MHTYLSVDGRVKAVNGPCTSRVHGRFRPCTWHVHGRVRAMYTYMYTYMRVHGRYMAVNGLLTGRVHECVHGRVPPCTRPVYTALYGPCTRPCTRRAHGQRYTRQVYTRTRPLYGRIHVHERAMFASRPCNGRFLTCTWRIHDRVTAVSTGRVAPCTRPCTYRVHLSLIHI